MSDSSDSSKPRPKAAAVPHYTVGEEIMNSVTHGVGCLLGIAGLVLLIVFAALRGGGPAHMAAANARNCTAGGNFNSSRFMMDFG